VADIVNRDVIQLSEIERGPQMRALIRLVAGLHAVELATANSDEGVLVTSTNGQPTKP